KNVPNEKNPATNNVKITRICIIRLSLFYIFQANGDLFCKSYDTKVAISIIIPTTITNNFGPYNYYLSFYRYSFWRRWSSYSTYLPICFMLLQSIFNIT